MKNLQEIQEEEDSRLVQQPPTISEIINNRSIGKFQFTAAFIIGTFCMLDCAELIIIAFLALIMEDIWDLSLFQKGLLGTALYFGYFVGSFIVGPISDHFGRKKTIITASIILFTSGTCSAFMPNYYLFALTRSFVGLGIGMMASSGNTYLAEIYSTKWRGKLFQLHFLFGQIGQVYVCLLAYWLISDLSSGNWRLMILLVSLPTLIPLIGMFFMPESPLWLANANKQQQAIDALQEILRRNNDQPLSQQEIQGIRNTEPVVTEGIQNILNVQFRSTSLLLWYM